MHAIPHLPSSNGNGAARPVSYEQYLTEQIIDLTRTLAHRFDASDAEKSDFNARRAYSAIGQLQRIEVGA